MPDFWSGIAASIIVTIVLAGASFTLIDSGVEDAASIIQRIAHAAEE